MEIILLIAQWAIFLTAAPLAGGLITKIKNYLRMRKGPSITQPYYNLAKLLLKGEVVSQNASWIFKAAPMVVLSCVIAASMLIPIFVPAGYAQYTGDIFVFIFILALGRFFLSLAGLDTASAFGGMGSSREMFISSMVEPVLFLSLFAISLKTATTNTEMLLNIPAASVSTILAGAAILMATLAETSRIPIDNQETHLELTMIHEAMVLEYSGPRLAMIEYASYLKQFIFFAIIANVLWPTPIQYSTTYAQLFMNMLMILAKISGIAACVAIIEVSIAKMRLFRAADFLLFSFALAVMATVAAALGA
ncbi:MAG TPA: formate hydrogenlyase [Candidatus Omnitrophica bacterium]|nr:formate hydrogenlyase [Candidatus Omnitrophota bacterium]